MLLDHIESDRKLSATWRCPFIISGDGGDMHKPYTLIQIVRIPILRQYHGDSLKPLHLREGYIMTNEEAISRYSEHSSE